MELLDFELAQKQIEIERATNTLQNLDKVSTTTAESLRDRKSVDGQTGFVIIICCLCQIVKLA